MSLLFQILTVLIIGILLLKFCNYESNYEISAFFQDDKRYYTINYNRETNKLEAFQNITNNRLFSIPLKAVNIKTSETIIPEEYEYIDEDKNIFGRMAIGGLIAGELGLIAGALSCMGLKKVVTKPKEHNLFLSIHAGIGREYIFKIPSYQKYIADMLIKKIKSAKFIK